MQRARCYLLGETAVVLELEPPVTLATQKRIWRLAQRLPELPGVVEAIPGMNNITVVLRDPHTGALDAIERLQRWWEESEALEPESRAEPRLSVPAGSVAIGGEQTGIYPLASPGGWQLIGHTSTPLFEPGQDAPILLRPGDTLRFIPQKEGVC